MWEDKGKKILSLHRTSLYVRTILNTLEEQVLATLSLE